MAGTVFLWFTDLKQGEKKYHFYCNLLSQRWQVFLILEDLGSLRRPTWTHKGDYFSRTLFGKTQNPSMFLAWHKILRFGHNCKFYLNFFPLLGTNSLGNFLSCGPAPGSNGNHSVYVNNAVAKTCQVGFCICFYCCPSCNGKFGTTN